MAKLVTTGEGLDAALERLAGGRALGGRAIRGQVSGDEGAETRSPDAHITAIRRLPAVPAEWAPFPPGLDARLRSAYESRGISRLYTHQAEAVDHALAGRDVVIITPTASGKTLCYNAPVLHAILQDPAARALYLFPTKALAQDQLAELQSLCEAIAGASGDAIGVFTYDGDTPQDARRSIRSRAHVVLSNPDMLHSGILPHHPRWAKLFENLRYIVIDELHAYRGVFGSHLANVLRRLRRLCRHYGSNPVFVCSSATIANPRELAERLTERPFALVEKTGAPQGEKVFLFVNPPVVNQQLGIRRSYLSETRRVASEFLKRDLQLIVFAQSRLATEILTTYLKDEWGGVFARSTGDLSSAIRGYRGGYLPNRRREIEKGLRDGAVRAVVSTSALELGVDIGALDVAVMAGYPGTVAATWQRAGRAGRRAGRSAAVLVASSAPLDQFIVRNPSYFFERSPEHALIDPDNLHILVDHVKCAAFELPFTTSDRFGKHDVQEILGILAEQGLVCKSPQPSPEAESLRSRPRDSEAAATSGGGAPREIKEDVADADRDEDPQRRSVLDTREGYGPSASAAGVGPRGGENGGAPPSSPEAESLRSRPRDSEAAATSGGGAPREVKEDDADALWTWTSESYPADAVSLRSVSSDNFIVVDTTGEARVIGETDFTSGPATLHPKAIYLVEAKLYQVERLDFVGRKAFVREIDCDYYTDAITHTRVTILDSFASDVRQLPPGRERLRSRAGDSQAVASHGEVHVVSRVVGFKKIKFYTSENVGSGELDLPEQQMHTTSYWLTIPPAVMNALPFASDDRRDGVVGLAFAMRQVAQLLLMCDRHDIGLSMGTGAIFIYDNYPGGIGFSEPLFRMHDELLAKARRLIEECDCETGCPSCVGPVGYTGPHAKAAALRILQLLLSVESLTSGF